MQRLIAEMLTSYEQGRVSRRRLVQGLAALAAGGAAAAPPAGTFQGVANNHVAIRVTNIPRSRDFYQKHLGMPVVQESEGACFLGLKQGFLTLFRNQTPGLDHFCIAIENFNADRVMAELKRQNLNPRRAEGTDRVYFPDPDGLTVQLSADGHQP